MAIAAFTPAELLEAFDLTRVTSSPAVFDFDKLNWVNRHYLKSAPPDRISALALPHFVHAGFLPATLSGPEETWLNATIALLLPSVDRLDQLPERAAVFFAFDATAAKADAANAEVLATPKAQTVLNEFATRVVAEGKPLTGDSFKAMLNDVKTAAGAKGKELFQPLRIALTGSIHGPEFDKLIPLIEDGASLALRKPVLGVRARLDIFLGN